MKTKILTTTLKVSLIALLMCLLINQNTKAQFYKGADVSWISEMESSGYKWYDDNGTQKDLLAILKEHEINTIRLRLWMNPSGGYSGWEDVLYKAKRANEAGLNVMITIHYSDTWADPGTQTKPSVWSSLSFSQLTTEVYNYTYNLMVALKNVGVTPVMVQVGNETNDGMLWQDGRASINMANYAALIKSGYNAIKAVSSSTKVVVHVSNGWDNSLFQWNIGGLINNGANFDVIGMSLYPTPDNWQTYNTQCLANMKDMKSRYGKDVMICEVGMRADYASTCKSFVADIISKTRSVGGIGVLYWEPQVYNGWKGYGLGAWQENGRPSVAMDGFIEGTDDDTSIDINGTVNGTYTIIATHSGKAIDTYAWGTTNGTNICQWSTWGGATQQYIITPVDGIWHRISPSISTGQAMDVNGISTADGANIQTWEYQGGYNQQFKFQSAGSGVWRIINRNSEKCLDVENFSTANGANIVQWTCISGNNNQMFSLTKLSDADNNSLLNPVSEISVYPNPATNFLHLEIPESYSTTGIGILNSIGQQVMSIDKVNTGLNTIDVRSINAGMYFIQMLQGKEVRLIKIAVQ